MRPTPLKAVPFLLLVSGAAGLVYQVVWARLLNEIFGVTIHAVTAVLATFLGGLALGGWLLGRAADRSTNPLRFYGWLEVGIGLSAFVGAWVVRALDPVHMWAASRLAPDSGTLLALRVLFSAVVVLPPTFLMGGTLPVITKALVRRMPQLGRQLSFLYALNTAGAVTGSLLAGFLFIRALGVHPTLWLVVVSNLAVGVVALWLARNDEAATALPAPDETVVAARNGAWGLLAVMGVSGFASLALEVMWTRMLLLIIGTSTYAFVTMLSTFLVGIATGSLLARSFIDRTADPRRLLGWVQAGIAASTLAAIPAMGALVAWAQRWCEGIELQWIAVTASRFGVSFLVMIVPTTLIGMTFPLAGRIWARNVGTLSARLGQVYGANAFGNVLGALFGGFVLLPAFGIQRGIALVAGLNLAGAGWGLLSRSDRERPVSRTRILSVVGGVASCALFVALWYPKPFATTEEGEFDPVLYYREGIVSTVKVIRRADDGQQLLMFVDGVRIGQSSAGVDRKQQVLAHLPFLLAVDRPLSRVLSIGLGTGILIGEIAKHPGVESIECIEISPSVIEAARLFRPYNGGVFEDPRIRIVNDDGVNYLRRSPAKFDAIVSDGKSRSGHAGNALFYSRDYYQAAREHLSRGGLMVQWVPFDVPSEDLQIILRTFTSVFPNSYVWMGHDSCFLVGSNQPLVLDVPHIGKVLNGPATASLRRYGWRNAYDVVGTLIADDLAIRSWISQGQAVNSFETPVLEFYSPRSLAVPSATRVAENLAALRAGRRGLPGKATLIGADASAVAASIHAVNEIIDGLVLLGRGEPVAQEVAAELIERGLAEAPSREVIGQVAALNVFNLAYALDREGALEPAITWYRRALSAWPDFIEAHVNLGRSLARQGRTDEGVSHLRRALELNPDSGVAYRLLAAVLQSQGAAGEAVPLYRQALRLAPDAPDLHHELGVSLALAGNTQSALAELGEAMRLRPDWPAPMARMALLLAIYPEHGRRNLKKAIELALRASQLTHYGDPLMLETLAAAYAAAGRFDEAVTEEGKALEIVKSAGDPAIARQVGATLELYKQGKTLPQDLPPG